MEVVFGVVRIRCVWARSLPFGRIICWTMFSTGHLSCASILRHDVLCCLFYFCISFCVPRHNHPRFLDVTLRITKGGSKTTDMLVVRVYSFFACITEEEEAALGRSTFIQCSAEHVNLPQLFMGALFLASSCPAVSGCCGMLAKMPVFPSMSSTGKRDKVIFQRMRTLAEINGRLARDLRRIGMDMVNGQRAIRSYGFRRGGAQDLLDRTGNYELVMRLGDWKPDSNSFFVYLTNMNARGTLRSTLRSHAQEDVTQTVSQIMRSYNQWAVGVVGSLRGRVTGLLPPLSEASVAAFDADAAAALCSMFVECVLQLRHGRDGAVADEEEA